MCRFEGKNPKNSIVRLFFIGRGSINIRQRIFWTQVGLDKMNDTLPCGNFSPSFPSRGFVILHITLLFFRQLLLYHLPHLHNQLEEAGVAPVVYATPWFITLFAYKNPLHVTWFQREVFVEERWEIHWRPLNSMAAYDIWIKILPVPTKKACFKTILFDGSEIKPRKPPFACIRRKHLWKLVW